jgi:hypothetical protein
VYIPKRTLFVLALMGAALLGWMLRVDMGGDSARPAAKEVPTRLEPEPAAKRSTTPAPGPVTDRPQIRVSVVGGGSHAGTSVPAVSSPLVEAPTAAPPEDAAASNHAPTSPPGDERPASVESMAAALPFDLDSLEEQIFRPLPGAESRAVTFSGWESARADIAGTNVMVTTDDSNLAVDRDGRINGNTGDTDGAGLNVTDATESDIRGSDVAAD